VIKISGLGWFYSLELLREIVSKEIGKHFECKTTIKDESNRQGAKKVIILKFIKKGPIYLSQ